MKMMQQHKNIIVTGGAGFVGSHIVVALQRAGHSVFVIDNFSNAYKSTIDKLQTISQKKVPFERLDIKDTDRLKVLFQEIRPDAVIHLAGLKAVGEAVEYPLRYYDVNVGGTLSLLKAMEGAKVYTLIFSSSATVYGEPQYLPIDEAHPLCPIEPYGQSKLMVENILSDIAKANTDWRIGILRYFNPVGAHKSGLIGENPKGIPNNLMPYLAQVANGKRENISIYGNDYPTKDGTGARDYIHVIDIARAHLDALNALTEQMPYFALNLGSEKSYTVREVIEIFENVTQRKIPYKIEPRRKGDIAERLASFKKAKEVLNWKPEYDLDDICKDIWRFQQNL